MRIFNKAIALILAVSIISGCSNIGSKKVETLALVPPLSEKEVVDYYKKAMDFDTLITRNLNVDDVTYVTRDVTSEKQSKLAQQTDKVERILGLSRFPDDNDPDSKVISESVFNYIKTFLDDKRLTNGNKVKFSEALGHYFVDVEYKLGARSAGRFTDKSNFLGIHGAFKKTLAGIDTIDASYMGQAVKKLNDFYRENKINKSILFDRSALTLSVSGDTKVDFTILPPVNSNEDSNASESSANTAKEEAANEATEDTTEETAPIVSGAETTNRSPILDLKLFNRIGGASTKQAAYTPDLDVVYIVPNNEGTISGYGIYPSGNNGLRSFGFNRNSIDGTVTIRYVFKDNVLNPSIIDVVNVYPITLEVTTGIESPDEVIIPDFVKTELEKMIEKSDRALVNNDIQGLMGGTIYSDIGKAVLNGHEHNWVNVLRNISTIRRVIARDTRSNKYVVEVETLKQEGPKGVDSYGTYMDTYYICIEQSGTDFVITDSLLRLRTLNKEPQLKLDSSITKRLVALNLAGDIKDSQKTGIESLLSDLYTASSYRILTGPIDVKQSDGTSITLQRGMYDCFNSDTSLLSSSRKEYLNSSIREQLVKHGVGVPATYRGIVTEWMGAADRQAEFTTEELITYGGRNDGYYTRVYYLVSNMSDVWVIDEMNTLEAKVVSGDELATIQARIQ